MSLLKLVADIAIVIEPKYFRIIIIIQCFYLEFQVSHRMEIIDQIATTMAELESSRLA